MEFNIWLTMFLAAMTISVSPGAGAVVSMNYGLKYGLKKSYPAIFGLQVGYILNDWIFFFSFKIKIFIKRCQSNKNSK